MAKAFFSLSFPFTILSHQLFKREIPFHSIGKSCHCSNQLTIIISHLNIAIWQFVMVEQFRAFCRDMSSLLSRFQEGDGIANAQRQCAMTVGNGSKRQVSKRINHSTLAHPSTIQMLFLHGEFCLGISFAYLR